MRGSSCAEHAAEARAGGRAQPPTRRSAPPSPSCSDQLARARDRLRVDLAHLAHPVYGVPDLAQALHDNPAEYLPIVSRASRRPCRGAVPGRLRAAREVWYQHHLVPTHPMHALQLEQAAKQESLRIQSLAEDGSDPDVKDVQARAR